jgi:glutamate/tyrosine decarboxylase-like PLP-dependent enzyme
MTTPRPTIPEKGTDWTALREELVAKGSRDADWRRARTAVYVFNAGPDVLAVAKDAYALYQSENALGPMAFPSLKAMEAEVVGMGLSLLHAPDGAAGSMTSGGTESILLAVKTCRDEARSRGVDTRDAEIVLPRSAHPAFDKAALYLGLRTVRVPVAADLRADVAAMRAAIGPRTRMIVGSAPCFPYGVVDPIGALSALALETETWLHVDACVGGWFIPFAKRNGVDVEDFDFVHPGVRSISGDLHKYGYAAKGASTVFHRTAAQWEHQVFRFDDWPAGGMTTPTMAGTRPGGAIASAWAVLRYLGVEGYREKARLVCETRQKLCDAIRAMDGMVVHGDPRLGLFSYGSTKLDAFALFGGLMKRGWFSGLTSEPRGVHQMLSPAHAEVADEYLADLRAVIAEVTASGATATDTKARYA